MKKEADLRGAEVTPISSTEGMDAGIGVGLELHGRWEWFHRGVKWAGEVREGGGGQQSHGEDRGEEEDALDIVLVGEATRVTAQREREESEVSLSESARGSLSAERMGRGEGRWVGEERTGHHGG